MANNLKGKDLQDVIKLCNLKPRRNHVLLTINKIEAESSFEIEESSSEDVDQYQYVVAAGDGAEYQVGDKVLIDLSRLVRTIPDDHDRTRVNYILDVTPVKVGDNDLTILSDNYILAKEVEYPEIDIKS